MDKNFWSLILIMLMVNGYTLYRCNQIEKVTTSMAIMAMLGRDNTMTLTQQLMNKNKSNGFGLSGTSQVMPVMYTNTSK